MSRRSRYGMARLRAQDDDTTGERDMLYGMLGVFLALIGHHMVTAARTGPDGATEIDKPVATVYLNADASVRLDNRDAAPERLEDITVQLTQRLEAATDAGPIVLCHAPEVPGEHVFHVLQRINTIPHATTYLALQAPEATR